MELHHVLLESEEQLTSLIKLNVLTSVLGFRLFHNSLDEIQSLAVRVVHPNHLMYFIHSNALKP